MNDPRRENMEDRVRELERTVAELNRLEKMLRFQGFLLDSVEQTVIATDVLGKIVFWNRFAERLHGWSAEEVMGKNVAELEPPIVTRDQVDDIMECVRDGKTWEGDFLVRRRNGSTVHPQLKVSPVYDEGGNLIGTVGIAYDITERLETEKELRESEESFRELADLLPGIVYELDEKGKVTFVNRRGLAMTGYAPEDLGKGFDALKIFTPDCREEASRNMKLILEGESLGANEYTVLRKDGSTFPVLNQAVAIMRNGKTVGLRGIMFDITDRKRAEEALRESEKKYSTLVEKGSDGIVVIQDGCVRFANTRILAMTGWKLEEFLHKPFIDFVTEEYKETALERYREKLSGGGISESYYIEVLKKDGSSLSVEVNGSLIEYEGKTADLVIIRDVTERRRVEETVKAAEREKSLILNATQEMFTYYDNGDLVIKWANKAAGDSVGLDPGELVGRHCYEIWHGRSEPCEKCPVQKAWNTGEPQEGELTTPDGRMWFIRGYPVLDDDGNKVGIIETTQNITDRKLAEKALHESEKRYRIISEMTSDYIAIIDMNTMNRLRVESITDDFLGISGYTLDELQDTSLWYRMAYPGDYEHLRGLISEVVMGEKREANIETRWVTKNGEVRWVHIFCKPCVDEVTGEVTELYLVGNDITERKNAERALRESEEKYRILVESSPDIIMRFDRDCRYNYVSSSVKKIIELEPEDFMGRTPREVGFPEERDGFWEENIREVFETGRMIEERFEFTGVSGKMVFDWRLVPEFDEDGNVQAVMSIARDITVQTQLENERNKASKLESIGLLAGGIAHDFNNILAAILGNISLAKMIVDDDIEITRY